jgi:hypothetical protein
VLELFLPAHRRDDRGCGRQAALQVTPAASMTEGPRIQGDPGALLFKVTGLPAESGIPEIRPARRFPYWGDIWGLGLQ